MKIVVNTRSLMPGKLDGIGWFTYQTMKRIVSSHPEHEFYFLFDRPYSEDFIFSKNVHPVVLFPPARHPFLYLWYYQWSIARLLNKLKPDLFVTPDGMFPLNTHTKVLAVVHDINHHHYPADLRYMYARYYNLMVPHFVRKASRIATVSEFSKTDIVNNYNVKANHIDVVYNGINDEYKPLPAETVLQIRNEFSRGLPYFLFVGSQSPRKNLARLIEAFGIFKKKSGAPHLLLIAGSSFWGEEKIKKALDKIECSEDVIFTGRLEQHKLAQLMGSAFALTFVSYFEGFGIPLIEAMQCDVPVICSNTTCMPEIAGDAALQTDPFHAVDIAEKMLKLYQDPELVKLLIEKGRERRQQFSWDKTAGLLFASMLKAID